MTPHVELYACHLPSLETGMIWPAGRRGKLCPNTMLRLIDKFTDIEAVFPVLEDLLRLSADVGNRPHKLENTKLPIRAHTTDALDYEDAFVYVHCQLGGFANNGWPIAILLDYSVAAEHPLRQRIISYGG